MDQAIEGSHMGLFFNQGQVLLRRIARVRGRQSLRPVRGTEHRRAQKRTVGDPVRRQAPSKVRRWIKRSSIRVLGYIESGQSEGAKLNCGGERVGDKGYFVEPTVFSDVQDDMKIAREEIFGPVMSIIRSRHR